jgi:RAD50-interacting protein 1
VKATKASDDHSNAVKAQIETFNKQREDIDRRLMIVTQSNTSDEAVRIFESTMEKLRRLDVAKGYVELLTDIETLGYVWENPADIFLFLRSSKI